MIDTKTILLKNVPIPQESGNTFIIDIPIHIFRIERETLAVIEYPRPYGFALLGEQFAHGAATCNPNDIDDPAVGEKIAIHRACGQYELNFDGDGLGPVGKIIYREYRKYLNDTQDLHNPNVLRRYATI